MREFDASLPYGEAQGREIVLHCRSAVVFDLVAGLQALGAHDITVRAFDYLFRPTNTLTERLLRRLG
jgi:ATP phosphoribosyltransferase